MDEVATIEYFFLPANTRSITQGTHTYTGLVTNQTAQNYDTLVFGDVASPFAELVDGPSQTAPEAANLKTENPGDAPPGSVTSSGKRE